MSVTKPKKREKKFAGFTNFPQDSKQQEKKEPQSKEPFTGFSEFYKKIREKDVFDDHDSEADSFELHERRKEEKAIKGAQELEEPLPKHFQPQAYYRWCKQRTTEALKRCTQEHGDLSESGENEQTNIHQEKLKEKCNPQKRKIQRTNFRKYQTSRKIFDRSEKDYSSENENVNPWFHNMLTNWREEKNDLFACLESVKPPQDENVLEKFYKCLITEKPLKLCDPRNLRNINTYPNDFQFQSVNDRLKRYLTFTSKKEEKDEESDSKNSFIRSPAIPDLDHHIVLTAERRDLTDYFNKTVRPAREISFKPEDFKSWYAKMSFNYERKFMKQPRTKITADCESFESWLNRTKENMNKGYGNKFCKMPYDMRHTRRKLEKKGIGEIDFTLMFDSSTDGDPSISHYSSCRSRVI